MRSRDVRRTRLLWQRGIAAPPLVQAEEHGRAVCLTPGDVRASDSERWVEPFLAANRVHLGRLHVTPTAKVGPAGIRLELHPGDRVGAVPLLSPTTRRVAAGLLIRPRFGWSSVGAVLGGVGYRVEPDVGGAPLVPGSAREVPPWILAGPVLARVAALVRQFARRFVEAHETRETPRGRVDWNAYARRSLPSGYWQRFHCIFPDLQPDPWLLAALRWTLRRLAMDLEPTSDAPAGRKLLLETQILLRQLGWGPEQRPANDEIRRALSDPLVSDFLRAALEAVGWIRDERGLGGSRSLDGLAWSLATDRLWEAWVEAIFSDLGRQMGARFATAREGSTRRPLVWRAHFRTLGYLTPDLALRLPGRTIWIDAKYKAHLIEIHRSG